MSQIIDRAWPMRPLGEVCTLLPAKSIALAGDTAVRAITSACLTELGFEPSGIKPARMWARDVDECVVGNGEILMARSNTPELVGRVASFDGEPEGVVASDLTIRILPSGTLHTEFLTSYLSALYCSGYWKERAGGASGSMKKITRAQVFDTLIPVPSLEEQRSISEALNRNLESVRKAQVAASLQQTDVELLPKKILWSVLSELPIATAEDVRYSAASAGLRWSPLNQLATLESGHTPSRHRPDWWGGDISWLSLTEIRKLDGKWVSETELRTNAEGIANSSARMLPKGTVCLSRTASVGFVAVMDRPMATSQDFANWVCGPDLDPEYLMYSLIASRDYLRRIAVGATHKTIYMPALQSFHILHPPVKTQRRIANKLKDSLATIAQAQAGARIQVKDLELLPQKLLAQAFDV